MTYMKQSQCFDKNVMFWKVLGVYPYNVDWKFYGIYSKTLIFLFIILNNALLTINFNYLQRDLSHFIEEMTYYFTVTAVTSKVITFIVVKEKIVEILKLLDIDMFQPQSIKGMHIITKAMKFNDKYWNIVAVASYLTHFIHVIFPFLIHLFLRAPLKLPICSYSFLEKEFKENNIYILYFYQGIGVHTQMLYNISIDTFLLGLMIFIIAQLEILEEKLITVTNDIVPESAEEVKPDKGAPDEEVFVSKLNQAIIHYDTVIKFCSLIEEVFSITLFMQFGMGSCIICICLFRFTLPAPLQYYLFLSGYIFIMVIQILVPCWFGTRIIDKSGSLSQAIYDCDWTPRSRRFKSSLRLFVERANRPLSITGWKMFPLSLTTFTSIMNSAYSIFTLLRYMQSRGA